VNNLGQLCNKKFLPAAKSPPNFAYMNREEPARRGSTATGKVACTAARVEERNPMRKPSFLRIGAILVLFCAVGAIPSPAQVFTNLYSFCSQSGCSDGGKPLYASLVQGSDGNFYGTTYLGGSANGGTVFKITPAGARTTLYSFCTQGGCVDGTAPYSGLAKGSDGNFYGTTSSGGAYNLGTVFKITSHGAHTTLYSFCPQSGCPDGSAPYGALIQGHDGNFYGTTYTGGSNNQGTVFKISSSGSLTTLHSFDGSHGSRPRAALVQGSDGNFYGTTERGGSNGFGSVFKMTPQGTVTTLYSFCGEASCADGATPYGGLAQGADGNYYGTTSAGGTNYNNNPSGTIFKVTPSGALTTIYNFCSQQTCADGIAPLAGLIRASDGNFYGTVSGGGTTGAGTVFRITPSGTLSTLHNFCSASDCGDGSTPEGGVVQGSDGNFYGETYGGGANFEGTVYQLARMQFVAVTPCRLIDTRHSDGEFGGPSLQTDSIRSFTIPDNHDCNIPSTAAAYSLNVTVVPQSTLGYLTVWPTGGSRPQVSLLNSEDGRIKANAAIVPSGTAGAISFFVTDDTDLVIDINGYFAAPGQGGLSLYPVAPCRVLDTRQGSGAFLGTLSPPVDLRGSACAVPTPAQAYVLNATAVPVGPLGYLTLWPDGGSQPVVSTLNALDGVVNSNMAIVPAGTAGKVNAYAYQGSSPTNLVLDIFSYFAP
jgi:uncharacterized repeat protein (TIGR03803 family)